jgi:uncharacterized protein YceK
MTRTVLLLLLISSLLVSGCGQVFTPEPEQSPMPKSTPTSSAPVSEWTISMTHSGGIMGLSRSIEISSDGKLTVVDNRTNKTVSGKITTDDLSELNELLMSIDNHSTGKPNGMVCADCFIYDLEVRRDGERMVIQLNDITLPGSEYEVLINQLRGLMDTALK